MDEFYSHKAIPLNMDPKDKWEDLLIKQIALREYHGTRIGTETMCERLLDAMPDEYETTVELLRSEINRTGDYDVDTILETLCAKHRRIVARKKEDESSRSRDEVSEKGLTASVKKTV